MRGFWWLAMMSILLSGCTVSTESDDNGSPSISMDVSRNSQNGNQQVSATLTSVRHIDDWSELDVSGCTAPSSGPINTPHKFAGCQWDITIRYAPTNEVLYRTP